MAKVRRRKGDKKGSICKQYFKHDEVVLLKDLTLKASNSVLSGPSHPLKVEAVHINMFTSSNEKLAHKVYATNITLLGLAMVNCSIGLLDPGGDNSYCGINSCTGPISW